MFSRSKYLLLLSFLIVFNAHAQYFEESQYTGIGIPFFDVSITREFNDDLQKASVDIAAQILYDDLTFVKSDTSGYDAELEWLVAVYKDEDHNVFSQTYSKKISTSDYENTNSRELKITLKNKINLEPGEYDLLMRTTDLNTNKSSQRRIKIEIPDYYAQEIAISDVMFLNTTATFDSLGHVENYDPVIAGNFTAKSGKFFIYFSIFSKKTDQDANINFKFLTQKNREDFDTTITAPIKYKISTHKFEVSKKVFKENRYTIKVSAEIAGESSQISRQITFFWKTVPTTQGDIDKALQEMVYILNSDSLNYYRDDANLEEKQAFFKRFWESRDPDPRTPKNELMDEYFKRVNYANEHYSGFAREGWQTDRGRILIKFGPPDDIERHPFELDSRPYEIWRYYSLRKVFLFEDYTGFGDYRLAPDFINVEYQ